MTDRRKNKKTPEKALDLSTLVYGKVPPSAVEIEMALLGSMMMMAPAYDDVAELLTPEMFYVSAHQEIYSAIQQLSKSGKTFDILMVIEYLRVSEKLEFVGGPYYVTKITNSVVGMPPLTYARIVYEKYLKREMIKFGAEMMSSAFEDSNDAFELMDQFEKNYQTIATRDAGNPIQDLSIAVVERFTRLQELRKNESHITGVPTGYPDLDRITHGWQPTDLIILAARPAVGKTAFAMNLALNSAKRGTGVGFFSLEMSEGQLVDRLMSCMSEIWMDNIITGNIDEEQSKKLYTDAVAPLAQLPIFIDDTAAMNVYQLRAKARKMIRKHKVGLIIIDYLQLMSGVEDRKINNREQEISNISRNLKVLAKELNVPFIVLSQLSRDVEKRNGQSGKRPILSDLRDSGAIEQDADMVMFIYRPEYYEKGMDIDSQGDDNKGLTEVAISKHRNGSLAQNEEAIKFKALLRIQKFVPWEGETFTSKLGGPPSAAPSMFEKWKPVREQGGLDI